MMNGDQVQANGTVFASRVKEKWGALTEADLEGIAGERGRLAGKLQERYGYAKEQAEREAEQFLRVHPEANGGVGPRTTGSALAPAPPPPAHREAPPPGAAASPASLGPLPPLPDDCPLPNRPTEEATPAAGYAHSATVWISPRVLRWVAPVAVAVLFVLLFLPWTGAYPGGYGVYTQSAFQAIWGGFSVDPVGAEALGPVKPYDDVGGSRLMLSYALCVVLALALVLAPLALTPARAQALPPVVRSLWRRRLGLLGAVALVAFFLLAAQLWTDFGLEAAVAARVDQNLAGEVAAAKTPEEQQTATIHRGLQLGAFGFGSTLWLRLAVALHVLLLTGVGLELWIKRRGTRPLPQINWRA
jgi:uncharacterized protein YjbJ (UPF0337 family)